MEKYLLRKIRAGQSGLFYEKLACQVIRVDKLCSIKFDDAAA